MPSNNAANSITPLADTQQPAASQSTHLRLYQEECVFHAESELLTAADIYQASLDLSRFHREPSIATEPLPAALPLPESSPLVDSALPEKFDRTRLTAADIYELSKSAHPWQARLK